MNALKRYPCLLHMWVRDGKSCIYFLIAVRIGRTNLQFIWMVFYSREIREEDTGET